MGSWEKGKICYRNQGQQQNERLEGNPTLAAEGGAGMLKEW